MAESFLSRTGEIRIDEFGNVFSLRNELSRGGQGVVYRTKDPDLAIKQPIDPTTGEVDLNSNMRNVFRGVRCLPIPKDARVALPLSILRDEPGYVMRLLRGMRSFDSAFYLKGDAKEAIRDADMPGWLQGADRELAISLIHYSKTGSTKRRLLALAGCAAVLGRLHSNGLVYCDLSPKNAFIDNSTNEVYLIDADNLRFERQRGGSSVYTPRFGSPEVVQGLSASREVSDVWSFAVMAFEMLVLNHPFVGLKVLDPDNSDGGWDSDEEITADDFGDLDERAYAGKFPFVDDENDDSNAAQGAGLPRELVLTPMLRWMFQQTLGYGRTEPYRRTPASLWAMAMAQAHDHSLICPACEMSYYSDESRCPYCDADRPKTVTLESSCWDMVIQKGEGDVVVPHRLLHPFDLQHYNDTTEYQLDINFNDETVAPSRGYADPSALFDFEFSEEGR
ncbi:MULTISPECIES: protein kinase domain-containing protein [unclassified Collinsella]|uniref:protein kinase domain-containing protein n=1 Tax=unclassified Collinsella TaxID=2637548 RepID=UPI003F899B96